MIRLTYKGACRLLNYELKGIVAVRCFFGQTCSDRKYLGFFLIWPIINKVRHNFADLALQEKALIVIPRLLLQRLNG